MDFAWSASQASLWPRRRMSGSAERSSVCVCVCMMVHGAAPKHVKAWRIFARDGACWGNVGGCWGMSGDV